MTACNKMLLAGVLMALASLADAGRPALGQGGGYQDQEYQAYKQAQKLKSDCAQVNYNTTQPWSQATQKSPMAGQIIADCIGWANANRAAMGEANYASCMYYVTLANLNLGNGNQSLTAGETPYFSAIGWQSTGDDWFNEGKWVNAVSNYQIAIAKFDEARPYFYSAVASYDLAVTNITEAYSVWP